VVLELTARDATGVTASAIVRFAEELETSTCAFYRELAQRFPVSKEKFLSYANDSKKNRRALTRTYQETISDALEACFSFEGLDLAAYTSDTSLPDNIEYEASVKLAISIEETAARFYDKAAKVCDVLLATIPRAFMRVAKKRRERKSDLSRLLKQVHLKKNEKRDLR
jgi:rubrerythrin